MLDTLIQWAQTHETLLTLTGFISLLISVGSLIILPWLVAQLPVDYFAHDHREAAKWKELHPVLRFSVLLIKNSVGIGLLTAGIAMLILPGQGLLSMLMGLILMDYPGKFRLERYIVSRPKLLQLLNWIRQKQHKPPLLLES